MRVTGKRGWRLCAGSCMTWCAGTVMLLTSPIWSFVTPGSDGSAPITTRIWCYGPCPPPLAKKTFAVRVLPAVWWIESSRQQRKFKSRPVHWFPNRAVATPSGTDADFLDVDRDKTQFDRRRFRSQTIVVVGGIDKERISHHRMQIKPSGF